MELFLLSAVCLSAALAAAYAAAKNHGGALMFSANEDDSDMKIAGAPGPAPADDTGDTEADLAEQTASGNLELAKKLGEELARKILDEDGVTNFGVDSREGDEVRRQRRLLLAFVVDNEVGDTVEGLLGHAVLNSFYDLLKSEAPDFYEDVRGSASFSFYLLCVRDGENVEHCIGNSFAMLAGYEGDKVMSELGEALYFHFRDIVSAAITACRFA
jgi:hypothetical protein